MKFRQEFEVHEPVSTVWSYFDQPARVAGCIPGVEHVDVVDGDHLIVRATQKVGPIGATFESKVHITERIHEERMQFTSTGSAVRGAVGNFRATNTVHLAAVEGGTRVVVEGEAALAGVLGSIGQKIIMRHADKVTAEFARNLEDALSGAATADAGAADTGSAGAAVSAGVVTARRASPARLATGGDVWSKASAVFGGLSFVVSLLILWRIGVQP